MRTREKLITAAAAGLLVVAVAGCQSVATPTATAMPTATMAPASSPALLASGTFRFPPMHTAVALDATGDGSDVTGTMTVSDAASSLSVDLECTLTADDGRILIGGEITDSTFDEMPKDTRYAIAFTPGSPVQAIFVWQGTDLARAPSCIAYLEEMNPEMIGGAPIEGTVELGP
jgi:hypothetical protein